MLQRRTALVFVVASIALIAAACTPPPVDTTAPVLTLPTSWSVPATGPSGATVTWTATATDNVDPTITVTCTPASGTQLPIGPTAVSCSATDTAGNVATGGFTVTVEPYDPGDTTAPVLTIPTGVTQEATSPAGANVSWTATATDDTDPTVEVNCSPASGTGFVIGSTPVSCSATDDAGNIATGGFIVTVVDSTAPVLNLPAAVVVAADGPGGAPASWSATAVDAADDDVDVTCTPASGTTFVVGDTPVSCTATDDAGNAATGGFTVTVTFTDDVPPVLTLPEDFTVEATGPSGAPVTWSATAVDDFDDDVDVVCTPTPATFTLGAHPVSCTATDDAGNTATGGFTVTVVDTTPPALNLPADFSVPATAPSGAQVTWTATTTDTVDGNIAVNCSPAPAKFAVGPTPVTCTAADAAGNTTSGGFTVTVEPYPFPEAERIHASNFHTCALNDDSSAHCWGNNDYGQLGNDTTANSLAPVTVTGLVDAIAIATGSNHTCALLVDGTARCWGANYYGQLGNNTTNVDSSTPVTVTGLADAVAITAGGNHTCAVLADGTARCWGWNNDYGQLGNGTIGGWSSIPVTVTGLADAIAITASSGHTCALLADYTVRCWGNNSAGQLGNGTTTNSLTPVTVSGITDAVAITASDYHTCAVLGDGTARCWGLNSYGALGDGTTTGSVIPVTVTGITDAVAITAGYHTCAVLGDGTARCWGPNWKGQLGNGTTTDSSAPVTVTSITDAVAISAGYSHTCALLADGTARCWGLNGSGQLGNGTTADSSTPVPVLNLP